MLNPKIVSNITQSFQQSKVIFWYDPEKDYADCVVGLNLPNTNVVLIEETPALKIKIDLEQDNYKSCWLLYTTNPEPEASKDWLLDLRKRSKAFYADSTSITLDELGLATQSLRPYLKTRTKFLNAKERFDKLKKLTSTNDSSEDIDLKMLAVITKAEQPEPFNILFKLFNAILVDGVADLETKSKVWAEIVSLNLEDAFWIIIKKTFGYSEEKPSLKQLLIQLLVTEFFVSLRNDQLLPGQLKHFVIKEAALNNNTVVFISRWRNDISVMQSYNQLSHQVGIELDISALISPMEAKALYDVMTFDVIEQRIIKDLKDQVLSASGTFSDEVQCTIANRRDGYWANARMAKEFESSKAFAACYDAIEAAASFFQLKAKYDQGFSFLNAKVALEAYKSELYMFDQLYRQFHFSASLVEPTGWSLLHELRNRIESIYSGWFIANFSSAWNKVLEGESGLLNTWHLDNWVNQQNFYDHFVKPPLAGSVKRIFVVISDAFRYEAAEELTKLINGRNKLQATLTAMLGVLPSYTTLGMAALLPHKTLAYKQTANLDVSADGVQVSSVDQRSSLLNQYNGLAVKYEDLLSMGKDKGRELVKDYSVIYVYHDRIDAIGDKQVTETKTFEAVEGTLEELGNVVNFIVNSLNGSTILVTADHGFMYQESALDIADKSTISDKPSGAIKTKKRYILGKNLGSTNQAWFGNTNITADTEKGEGSLDYWLPKGASRFHFAGGARFVHGSAMPQEIVVPVISIKQTDSDKARVKHVEFSLLGSTNKIVSNMQRFEFIQTEPVSDKLIARTVKFSISDGEALVSNQQLISFDSAAQSMDERKRSIILTLLSGEYERLKDYYLTARDVDSNIEALRIPIKIDLAFSNDF